MSTGEPIAYLSLARSLAAGHGARLPYGDLYTASPLTAGGPVSLGRGIPLLLSLDTHSLLSWARVLAVALYGANVFLFGLLALRVGVARIGAIALAVIFAGLSFAIHGTVQSEPLFFFLVLLGLHAFVSFFNRPSALSVLVVRGIAFGLSTVSRFLGEAFVIGGAIAILVFLKERFSRRIRDALILVIVGNIPILIWFSSVHNSPDTFAFHLITSYDVKASLFSIAGFIIPGVHSTNLRILIAAAIVIVVGHRSGHRRKSATRSPVRKDKVDWLMLLFAAVYLLVVLISLTLVDPLVLHGGDDRVLFLPFMLILLWCAQNGPSSLRGRRCHEAVGSDAATILVGTVGCDGDLDSRRDGSERPGRKCRPASPARAAFEAGLARIPWNSIIYSNEPDECTSSPGGPSTCSRIHSAPRL